MTIFQFLCLSLSINVINTAKSNFPIKEMLNIPENLSMLEGKYLCTEDANPVQKFCCSCKKDCFSRKNCCIDKLWNSTNPIPMDEYLDIFVEEADKYKDTTCESIFPLATKLNASSRSYFMISKCSPDASIEDTAACKNINNETSYEYNIPVIDNDKYLYKNVFCARCNFIEKFDLVNISAICKYNNYRPTGTFVQIGNTTTTTTTTTRAIKLNIVNHFSTCIYEVQRSDMISFQYTYDNECYKGSFIPRDDCLPSNKYYKLCNSYYAAMGIYANYHCYLCIVGDQDLTNKPYFTCLFNGDSTLTTYPWSFTISFSDQTKISVNGPVSNLQETYCNDNQVYNIFTETCEIFSCSNGYSNVGHSCQKSVAEKPIQLEIENPTFDKCILKSKLYLIIALNHNSNITQVVHTLQNVLNSSNSFNFMEIHKTGNTTFHSTSYVMNAAMFSLLNKEPSNIDSYLWTAIDKLYIARENPITTNLHGFDISRTFTRQRLCAKPETYNNITQNFTSSCSIILDNNTLHFEDISQWMSFDKYSIQRHISTCPTFYLQSSCKLVSITQNFTILVNQTLFVNDRQYKVNDYTPLIQGFGLCADTDSSKTKYYSWKGAVSDAQTYISYIGISLNIICYIFIIVTYLYFKELRTVPGYTTVGLCITLLLTDVLFLAAAKIDDNFTACKTVGILFHWCLLATHTWVIVIAFDLLSSFGSVAIAIVKSSTKRFIKYSLFVIIVPSLIVGIALILNEENIFVSGYGSNNICFIRYLYPRIYFYIIPIATSFIIAAGAFAKSIITIRLQENKTRKVLRNSGRQDNNVLMIGLKLVLTLGLIEMIGFIQIAKDELSENEEIINAFFATFYTICRSLRGVILFIIYMCTKQKLKLFRSLAKNKGELVNLSNIGSGTKDLYMSTAN